MALLVRPDDPGRGGARAGLPRVDAGGGRRAAAGEAGAVLLGEAAGLVTGAAVLVLLVGVASGAIALGVARAHPLDGLHTRLWPGREAGAPQPPGARGWAAYLLSCPWCLGAWLCAGLWACQGVPEGLVWPVAWAAAWGVSTATALGLERMLEG